MDAKGLQIILRAVALLRAEGFTDFTVQLNGDNLRYASPAVRDEVELFLAEEAARPVQDRIVTDRGSYEVSQLASRMARIDWCIVPSIWWESFGLVISEAWMFGRPVICSNVGGMAERNVDELFALHFQMGDHRALAETLRRACTEEGLWERLAAHLPQPPTREAMVEGFWQVYGLGSEPGLGLETKHVIQREAALPVGQAMVAE